MQLSTITQLIPQKFVKSQFHIKFVLSHKICTCPYFLMNVPLFEENCPYITQLKVETYANGANPESRCCVVLAVASTKKRRRRRKKRRRR